MAIPTNDFARYLTIRSAISPVLSPDGRRVAFLTDITGTYQVWSVGLDADPAAPGPTSATWPCQLTFFNDKVWELHGTGRMSHLLAVSDVGGNERQQFYLISNYGVNETGALQHDVRRLTTDDDAIHRFGAWSADGQAIIYTANMRNGVDFDLYWMDVRSGATRLIGETPGNRSVLAWSPDGRTVMMLDAVATAENVLYLVDVETGTQRQLTDGHPPARYLAVNWRTTGVYAISDRTHDCGAICRLDGDTGELTDIVTARTLLDEIGEGEGELELLCVADDGLRAAFTLNVEGYSILYTLDLATGRLAPVSDCPTGEISNLRFSANGGQLLFDFQSPTCPPDVWVVDLATVDASSRVRQVTFSNRAGVDPATFVEPDLIRFPTFDARSIPAFFYRPQRPMPPGGFPCILYVHGGPAGQQRPDFDVRFQYFLSQGYALLVTNVRGSTGYGRTYMGLDDVERRMDSVQDLKYAVHWLQHEPTVDGARVAIYGRSYGGFMVLAALTEYPELFAAGIDVVGIANWVTFLERTSAWRRAHREREYGSLVHHRALLQQISPIHKAANIQMPLMVVAGDNDPRVPLYESEQIVQRVREAGGQVEFLHYADEGHRISKLANRIDSFTRMAAFLDHHLAPPAVD